MDELLFILQSTEGDISTFPGVPETQNRFSGILLRGNAGDLMNADFSRKVVMVGEAVENVEKQTTGRM